MYKNFKLKLLYFIFSLFFYSYSIKYAPICCDVRLTILFRIKITNFTIIQN